MPQTMHRTDIMLTLTTFLWVIIGMIGAILMFFHKCPGDADHACWAEKLWTMVFVRLPIKVGQMLGLREGHPIAVISSLIIGACAGGPAHIILYFILVKWVDPITKDRYRMKMIESVTRQDKVA